MSAPTVRVAQAIAAAFSIEKLPIPVQLCQQFVVAALFGNAVTGFEDAKAKNLPIVIDHRLAGLPHNAIPTWGNHLRDDAVCERAGKALTRWFERVGAQLPAEPTFQFLKLQVCDVVTTQIRKHGLFLYAQRLLFQPEFAAIAVQILQAMKLPELPPAAASVAVATGYVPTLPSNTVKEHLQFLGGQRTFGIGRPGMSFAEWVAAAEPVAVIFPPPSLDAGRMCRTDHFSTVYRSQAELGLGFFLASTVDQFEGRVSVVTPILSHRVAADGSPKTWWAEFHRQGINYETLEPEQARRLKQAMSQSSGQGARLKTCPTCAEIFSNDRADLQQRCSCPRTH